MEQGKTFCNIFVADVHRENIPVFASNKSKEKTSDWFSHFKHLFVSFTSCLVQSILKKKVDCLLKLISKRTTRKTRFFILARPSCSILKKSAQSFFVKLKLIKMNSWMSQLSNYTKLSMLWTKFDFHIQVELFMELPFFILFINQNCQFTTKETNIQQY